MGTLIGVHPLLPWLPREMIQFDEHIFQLGWNHQLATLFRWNSPSKAFNRQVGDAVAAKVSKLDVNLPS